MISSIARWMIEEDEANFVRVCYFLYSYSLCAVQYYSVNERKREKKKRNKESVKVNVISSIRHARSLARSMIERRRDELFCSFLLFPLALSLSLARSDDLSHVFESDHVLSVTPLIRTSVEALQVIVLVVLKSRLIQNSQLARDKLKCSGT